MKYRSVEKDIVMVIVLTMIAAALVFIVPSGWAPIRILALPLVLILPGYALTAAAFPDRARAVPERLVFSLGLSLIIVILAGLALNFTPFGMQARSWAVFLSCITLSLCAIALIRRQRQSISPLRWARRVRVSFTFRQSLLLGLAALIIFGAIAASIIGAERQPRQGFTQLWILPTKGTGKAKNMVRLGVTNMELHPMDYRLAVDMDGKVVKEWLSISLNPNENWESTLALPQTGFTNTAEVEALLYRTDTPKTLYRHVVLWLSP